MKGLDMVLSSFEWLSYMLLFIIIIGIFAWFEERKK